MNFKFIAGGYGQACGIRKDDSAVRCWEWLIDDVHGIPHNALNNPLPTPSGAFTFVDTGIWDNSCGVKVDGTVECWSRDGNGNLNIDHRRGNAPGEDDIGYKSVTLDWDSIVCGLRKDDRLICWTRAGRNVADLDHNSPWRGNAQLLGIDLGGATLSPGFGRGVLAYTASVDSEVESVTVKPGLTNTLAYYAIYSETGGAAGEDGVVPLNQGANVIRIHVISADRTTSGIYAVVSYQGGRHDRPVRYRSGPTRLQRAAAPPSKWPSPTATPTIPTRRSA